MNKTYKNEKLEVLMNYVLSKNKASEKLTDREIEHFKNYIRQEIEKEETKDKIQ